MPAVLKTEPLQTIPHRIEAVPEHGAKEAGLSPSADIRTSISPWRYEIKFAVPRPARAALLADLRHLTETDRQGDRAGGYFVHSVYFDSPDLACYRAKVDGLAVRFKLRVRAYSRDEQDTPHIFKLEIKEREAERVRKVTATVEEGAFRILSPALQSFYMPDPEMLARSSALARFFRQKTLDAMAPVVGIGYRRLAMVSRLDRRCRLTLDDQLESAVKPDGFHPEKWHRGVSFDEESILEIKSMGSVPNWLGGIVRRHGLQRRAISKYALAIVRCGLATD